MFIKPWLLDKLNSFKHPQPLLTFVSILFDFNNSSNSDVELQHTFNVNSDLRQLNLISHYSFNLTIIGYPALPSITHPSQWVLQWGSHPHYFTFSSFIQNHLSNQCSTSQGFAHRSPESTICWFSCSWILCWVLAVRSHSLQCLSLNSWWLRRTSQIIRATRIFEQTNPDGSQYWLLLSSLWTWSSTWCY